MAAQRTPEERRRGLYAQLAVARKRLGLDDDAYRALLARHGATPKAAGGEPSATTMTLQQILDALGELTAKAGRRRQPALANATGWRRRRLALITRLWCALADRGVVRDPSEAAMAHWAQRHTRTHALEWASTEALNACVEGLKAWALRNGAELVTVERPVTQVSEAEGYGRTTLHTTARATVLRWPGTETAVELG